jgi:hypothetical protein
MHRPSIHTENTSNGFPSESGLLAEFVKLNSAAGLSCRNGQWTEGANPAIYARDDT